MLQKTFFQRAFIKFLKGGSRLQLKIIFVFTTKIGENTTSVSPVTSAKVKIGRQISLTSCFNPFDS